MRPEILKLSNETPEASLVKYAAEQIRAGFRIPVVYLASHTDEYTMARAKVTDPLGYLFKPVEDRELEITLEMALYRHHLEQEREELVRELQDALFEVRRLSGLLPICISCKKIRDDRNYWQQLDKYVADHTEARFSHGICPECYDKVVKPELEKYLSSSDSASGS